MRLFRTLWLLICACIPGGGQMQQGYMKRGISLTTIFCVVLAVTIFLELGALSILLIPLWMYSFFDTYNLRRRRLEGTPMEDGYLFGLSEMDSRKLAELMGKRHSLIGWALVAAGVLVLWQSVSGILYHFLYALFGDDGGWWLYDSVVHGVPRIVVTLLIMGLGVWFIRGPRQKEGEKDLPVFTPPREPFTAKGPYQPEAQVPVPLRITPEKPEEEEETVGGEPLKKEAHHGDNC